MSYSYSQDPVMKCLNEITDITADFLVEVVGNVPRSRIEGVAVFGDLSRPGGLRLVLPDKNLTVTQLEALASMLQNKIEIVVNKHSCFPYNCLKFQSVSEPDSKKFSIRAILELNSSVSLYNAASKRDQRIAKEKEQTKVEVIPKSGKLIWHDVKLWPNFFWPAEADSSKNCHVALKSIHGSISFHKIVTGNQNPSNQNPINLWQAQYGLFYPTVEHFTAFAFCMDY